MAINRLLIAILITIITALLVYFFVFPKYREFALLQSAVGSKQSEFNAKYAYFAEVNKIFNELEKRKDSLEKIDKALPGNVSLSSLVYYIQKKSFENGLVIKSLFFTKATAASDKNPIREIVFSLNVTGSYSALKNFLSALEKSASLFNVNNISFNSQLSSKTLTQSQQIYSFVLEIRTHSY